MTYLTNNNPLRKSTVDMLCLIYIKVQIIMTEHMHDEKFRIRLESSSILDASMVEGSCFRVPLQGLCNLLVDEGPRTFSLVVLNP